LKSHFYNEIKQMISFSLHSDDLLFQNKTKITKCHGKYCLVKVNFILFNAKKTSYQFFKMFIVSEYHASLERQSRLNFFSFDSPGLDLSNYK